MKSKTTLQHVSSYFYLLALFSFAFSAEAKDVAVEKKQTVKVQVNKHANSVASGAKKSQKAAIVKKQNAQANSSGCGDLGSPTTKQCFKGTYGDFSLSFSGKLVQEGYADYYKQFMNVLDNDLAVQLAQNQREALLNDRSLYARSTADFSLRVLYGLEKDPRIEMKQTFRFRYLFGGGGTVSAAAADIGLGDVILQTSKPGLTKNLWWSRESWIKFALDRKDSDFVSYAQIGLIPYQVGRGISLGDAYQVSGFLGLQGGFAVDQYAPAVLLHTDIVPGMFDADVYFALTENVSSNFKENNTKLRVNELQQPGGAVTRGTLTQNYIFALAPKYTPWNTDTNKTTIQPYWVQYHAPDQKSEFPADSNVYLRTMGIGIEQENAHFEWGVEAAFNTGIQEIKPWDRNQIKLVVNDSGGIEEQYTHVLDAGDAAVATNANKASVASASRGVDLNGQAFAGNLANAVDRFRPAQQRKYRGFFALGDFGYELKKDRLKLFGGMGYVSGDLDDKRDVAEMREAELLGQQYKGFLPIQSVYTGKRLSHFVFLNTGIPRFTDEDPRASTAGQNVTVGNTGDSTLTNEFTNLMYIGTALEWKPESLAHKKAFFKFNAVSYAMPARPRTHLGNRASGYLGTELNLETSIMILEKLKLFSYSGVMIPGQHYKDMKGAPIGKSGGTVGSNLAYVLNVGVKFEF